MTLSELLGCCFGVVATVGYGALGWRIGSQWGVPGALAGGAAGALAGLFGGMLGGLLWTEALERLR